MFRRDLIKSLALVPAMLSFSPNIQASELDEIGIELEKHANKLWSESKGSFINDTFYLKNKENYKELNDHIEIKKSILYDKNGNIQEWIIQRAAIIICSSIEMKCNSKKIVFAPLTSIKLKNVSCNEDFVKYETSIKYLYLRDLRIHYATKALEIPGPKPINQLEIGSFNLYENI